MVSHVQNPHLYHGAKVLFFIVLSELEIHLWGMFFEGSHLQNPHLYHGAKAFLTVLSIFS